MRQRLVSTFAAQIFLKMQPIPSCAYVITMSNTYNRRVDLMASLLASRSHKNVNFYKYLLLESEDYIRFVF